MSLEKQVPSFYDKSPLVAMEFYRIMNPTFNTKSTYKPLGRMKEANGDESGGEVAAPAAEGVAEEAAVHQIAQQLIVIANGIDQQITQDFREKFEAEFKRQSVFNLGYTGFCLLFRSSLASVQSKVRNGWEQVSLMYTGFNEIAREITRQTGDSGNERLERMAQYLRDAMHELSLEEWVQNHLGADPSNWEAAQGLVLIVPPEGTSV